MKEKHKEAKMAVLQDLIKMMRGEETKSWKEQMNAKPKPTDEMGGEEAGECNACKDGSCPECKKKGGLGIIIAVGKPKK